MRAKLIIVLTSLVAVAVGAASGAAGAAGVHDCGDYSFRNGPYGVATKGITCAAARPIVDHVYWHCSHRCTYRQFACALDPRSGDTNVRCADGDRVISFIEGGVSHPPPHHFKDGHHPKYPHVGCHPPGSTTVAHNAVARIFTLPKRGPDSINGHLRRWDKLYGCVYSVGTAHGFFYSDFPDEDYIEFVTLAGHYAGYVAHQSGAASAPPPQAIAHDLRTGHIRRDASDTSYPSYSDFVVKADGAIAWIQSPSSGPGGTEVRKLDGPDAFGSGTILDAATGIDPTSLTLSGSTLHWLRSGSTQTATLG